MYVVQFSCAYIATVKDIIDHYYDYLSVNMDAKVVTSLMISKQLLSEDMSKAAISDYQRNCLILQQVRQFNMQSLETFSDLLVNSESQKYIGRMLNDGEDNNAIKLISYFVYVTQFAETRHNGAY